MKQFLPFLPRLPKLVRVSVAAFLVLAGCTDREPVGTAAGDEQGWNVSSALAAIQGHGDTVTLAVSFRDSILPSDSALLLRLGGGVDYRFYTIPVLTTSLPEIAAEHLRRHPRVDHVSIGRRSRESAIREAVSWGFHAHEAPHAHSLGYTGQGMVIAIIDTGVECNLPDFQCVPGASFVSGTSADDDDNGHGTAMASEAAAMANGTGFKGIAPSASIMPIKVMDSQGILPEGCISVAKGVDYAAQNGADIINLSLASGRWDSLNYTTECLDEGQAINYAHNVALVTAVSGNIPQDGDSVPYPGRWDYAGIGVTAGLTDREVCDVFGTSCSNPVRRWEDSSMGSQIDISAAADSVRYLTLTGAITKGSGTSLAAPHIAGAAALLMERWPVLKSDGPMTMAHIRYTAKPPDDPWVYDPLLYGAGVLDIQAAIDTDPCTHLECPPDIE